jgi:hypothetical protein
MKELLNGNFAPGSESKYVVGWRCHRIGRRPIVEGDVSLYVAIDGDYYVTQDFRQASIIYDLGDAYRYLEAAKHLQARENFSSSPESYQVGIYRIEGISLAELGVKEIVARAAEKVKKNLTKDEINALRAYIQSGGEL